MHAHTYMQNLPGAQSPPGKTTNALSVFTATCDDEPLHLLPTGTAKVTHITVLLDLSLESNLTIRSKTGLPLAPDIMYPLPDSIFPSPQDNIGSSGVNRTLEDTHQCWLGHLPINIREVGQLKI